MAEGAQTQPDQVSRPAKPLVAALETVVVTVAMLGLGRWFNPQDPFFVGSIFSWAALAPLISGLRFGFAHGFASALMLTLTMAAAWRYQLLPMLEYPAQHGVGLLAVGMLAGEFSDMWTRRIRRLEVVSEYRRARLDEFARGYHILKVSHDSLERKVAGTSQNLREALMTVRSEMLENMANDEALFGLGNRVLGIFGTYGWLQMGYLYRVENNKINPEPIATLGEGPELSSDDKLLIEALTLGQLVTVNQESAAVGDTQLLAAIPLVDVQGRVWAMIAVRQMLFVAFQWENLKLLAVLGAHIADILAYGARMYLGEAVGADAFKLHLARSVSDARSFDLPASIVALVFRSSRMSELLAKQIGGQRRGLDQSLIVKNKAGDSVVFVLLPLTNELGLEGYLTRVERSIRERYGTSLEEAGITMHRRVVNKRSRAGKLFSDVCQTCGVDASDLDSTPTS